jgi:hypothetical protein
MSNFKDKFPSRYLKVDDLRGYPQVVTVTRVVAELVGREKDDKHVVYFREVPQGLVLNRVNGEALAGLAGSEDVEDWPGTRVQLYPARTTYQGKTVPCIRIGPAATGAPGSAAADRLRFAEELKPEDEAS